MKIDINCDMGEIPAMVKNGRQEALMPYVTSVNIACGGHAGDENMMSVTVEQAQGWSMRIGAHPGYPDRENFGRLPIEMPYEAVSAFVYGQVRTLAGIAKAARGRASPREAPWSALQFSGRERTAQ